MTAPFTFKPRIAPYFARQLGEHGGAGSASFERGRGLYREIAALDQLARELGVTQLSGFGFADDFHRQQVQWHPAAEGMRTVEALRQGLEARAAAGPRAREDLAVLASVLRLASDRNVDFCLTLRFDRDRVGVSDEERQGRFY